MFPVLTRAAGGGAPSVPSVLHAIGANRLVSNYTGPLIKLLVGNRYDTEGYTIDVPQSGGSVDTAFIAAECGSKNGYVYNFYDQVTGAVRGPWGPIDGVQIYNGSTGTVFTDWTGQVTSKSVNDHMRIPIGDPNHGAIYFGWRAKPTDADTFTMLEGAGGLAVQADGGAPGHTYPSPSAVVTRKNGAVSGTNVDGFGNRSRFFNQNAYGVVGPLDVTNGGAGGMLYFSGIAFPRSWRGELGDAIIFTDPADIPMVEAILAGTD